ncbi:hypothetical protein [Streptomyces sp. NPDC000877]|uniref:hypothetical protein n=1 Tax=unclassified Streptomyces TaxID=2593676 RepID=UPI003322177D
MALLARPGSWRWIGQAEPCEVMPAGMLAPSALETTGPAARTDARYGVIEVDEKYLAGVARDTAPRYGTVQGTGSTPAEAKKAADVRKSRSSAVLCCASTWTRKNTRRAGETCAGSRNTRFVGHGPAP